MCAQFTVSFSIKELCELLGAISRLPQGSDRCHQRILPFSSTTAVRLDFGEVVLEEMQFSLVPSWSDSKRPRFATHNARIETIAQKPTWKRPIEKHRALVPLSSFIEPVYRGEHAGNMINFSSPGHELLLAAALYDIWVDPQSGTALKSFAIITGEPSQFVESQGHDRQPIFIEPGAVAGWLNADLKNAQAALDFLKEIRKDPELEVHIDRPLKPGWEKRRNA